MQVVVADTGPINYLVLIDAIDLLPRLFDRVLAPQAVFDELNDPDTPAPVRDWIRRPSEWFSVDLRPTPNIDKADIGLDIGERAAISLALAIRADLVLMDDQAGVAFARRNGLVATGTLGVLDLAARQGLIDLAEAFERLKTTSFYYRKGLLDGLLAKHKKRR
jgi:predicted nucleic acid-binding protein